MMTAMIDKVIDDLQRLTLDDLLPRFPKGTFLILSNQLLVEDKHETWCLEASPSHEFFESDQAKWPWPTGMAWYGPTTKDVINKADNDLRKVKR
jgi:hypothetical protein